MALVLDTSVLIDLEREGRALLSALEVDEPEVEIHLPAVALAELMIGVELASPPRRAGRLRKVEALVQAVRVLAFDAAVAPTYARLYVELRRRGTPIPQNDLAIAAVAVHFDHELVVGRRDVAHFRFIPGLRVRSLGARDNPPPL